MMLSRRFSRLVSTCAAVSLTAATPVVYAGDLNAEVNDMFNSLGAIGNYSAPGAFRGQTYNTYTGGSLFYRAPNRTYQLASIQFPSARGGCGGIDLFGGSFSHISAAEFRNMLRNITSALPGIAFQLALKAVSPLLGELTEWAKGLETMINNSRLNSCETATALVSSAAEAVGFNAQRACAKLAMETGLESDIDSAMRRCRTDSSSIISSARESPDPNIAKLAPFVGNLTWEALKQVTTLDDAARELVMSLVGTVIYYPEADDRSPDVIPPAFRSVNDLLRGAADAPANDIRVAVLRCNNYARCDAVIQVEIVHEPLTKKVERLMQSISERIRTRTAIPNNSPEVGFVNTTALPVWRMLSVGNTIPGSSLADTMIQTYKDVIAADYAATFLTQFANVAVGALQKQYLLTERQQADANSLRGTAQRLTDTVLQEQANMYKKTASISTVASDLERLERNLRANMSAHVMDMLGHAHRGVQ